VVLGLELRSCDVYCYSFHSELSAPPTIGQCACWDPTPSLCLGPSSIEVEMAKALTSPGYSTISGNL
jgi:hypothetical protein